MKIIKYQLATEINRGTPEEPDIETVLSGVTMPYTETNYAMAQAEAYQGQITVEDDGQPEPEPEPSPLDRLGLLEEALAQTDETAIALFESQAEQASINAQQDDALLDIYEMLGG